MSRQELAATLRGRQMHRFERYFGGNLRRLVMLAVERDLDVMDGSHVSELYT